MVLHFKVFFCISTYINSPYWVWGGASYLTSGECNGWCISSWLPHIQSGHMLDAIVISFQNLLMSFLLLFLFVNNNFWWVLYNMSISHRLSTHCQWYVPAARIATPLAVAPWRMCSSRRFQQCRRSSKPSVRSMARPQLAMSPSTRWGVCCCHQLWTFKLINVIDIALHMRWII